MAAANPDFGVYVTLDELTALRYKGQGFNFLPRQPVHSVLSGRHASRMRGRGFDFEEKDEAVPSDIAFPYSSANLIMEGVRRIDDSELIRGAVGGLDQVVSLEDASGDALHCGDVCGYRRVSRAFNGEVHLEVPPGRSRARVVWVSVMSVRRCEDETTEGGPRGEVGVCSVQGFGEAWSEGVRPTGASTGACQVTVPSPAALSSWDRCEHARQDGLGSRWSASCAKACRAPPR